MARLPYVDLDRDRNGQTAPSVMAGACEMGKSALINERITRNEVEGLRISLRNQATCLDQRLRCVERRFDRIRRLPFGRWILHWLDRKEE